MTMRPTSSGGARTLAWASDERTVRSLLDALAAELASEEVAELERDANARRAQTELGRSEDRQLDQQRAQARQELPTFRRALLDADRTGGVVYDSADPEQDARADVLIHYLVRTGYAEVETDSSRPGRHRYAIQIDCPRLQALAGRLEERRVSRS
jgi:hypothetical protein